MRFIPANLGRRVAMAAFSVLSVAVAAYAFAYLYRDHQAHDALAAKFAMSGLEVPAHFFGAGLALLLAPVQLSRVVRRRLPRLHRIGGWLSAAGILIAAIGALSMARHSQGGVATGMAFSTLALLWLFCAGNGIRHVIAGDFAAHQRWMSRTAALTFSAVTLRVTLAIGALLPFSPLAVYIFAAWTCWPINLVLGELIRRHRSHSARELSPLLRLPAAS